MCKVIAICNQKGGVSKTTTTANLGVGLAGAGKEVLVIDADPQGNLSQSLGIENPDELEVALPSIMEQIIMDKEVDVTKGIIRHKEGLDLMPCNIDLSGVDVSLVNAMSREFVLKTYVESMREFYDYILIDCMPSLGMIGDKIVPFDNTMEKDSSLYQLFNTNFHEMVNDRNAKQTSKK